MTNHPVYNSNTISGDLTPSTLPTNSVPTSIGLVAPLTSIATRCRPTGPARTGLVEVPFVAATSATAADPTSFQSGDTTLTKVEMTVAHLTKRSHFLCPEGNSGLTGTAHILEGIVRDFEKDLFALATAKITAGSYGAADLTAAAAGLDTDDLKTLIKAAVSVPRVAMLPAAALMNVAGDLELSADGVWKFPGCDGGVYECDLSGDGHTAVAGPTALAYLVEKPEVFSTYPPREVIVQEIVLPRLQVPAWTCTWFDRASRTMWLSVESLFGVAAADATALAYAASP